MNKLSIKNRPALKRLGGGVAAVALLGATFFLGVTYGKNDGINLNQTAQLNSENTSLPADLNYNSVDAVYDSLKNNYDGKLTQEQLLDGLKSGLASATDDPYTQFFNPEDAKTLNEQLTGTFSGIGAQLGKDENGNLQIIAPISGTPAAEAGLQAKDLITQINGESTTNLEVDIAVSKIRGQAGSTVKLQIVRSGEVKDYTITRANISVPTVESKILDGNIGYLKVSQFTDDNASGEGTAALARKAAEDFKAKNVNGVVLDLRSNPGGTVNSAVGLTSLWLDQGKTVFQEKRGGQVNRTYSATGNNILKGVPTTVLIDGGSASASEITAGALKDTINAPVIGQKSYGKGSVQTVINLAGGSELKVTIGRWFRPNGDNIDKKGITPDQTVERSAEGDAQLDAAVAKLKS